MLGEADLEDVVPLGANQGKHQPAPTSIWGLGINISGVQHRFGLLMLADLLRRSTDTSDEFSK
jgi:hypothetical protein